MIQDPVEGSKNQDDAGTNPTSQSKVSKFHAQNKCRKVAGNSLGDEVSHETRPKLFAVDEGVENRKCTQRVIDLCRRSKKKDSQ